jgi:hypothetical protein
MNCNFGAKIFKLFKLNFSFKSYIWIWIRINKNLGSGFGEYGLATVLLNITYLNWDLL